MNKEEIIAFDEFINENYTKIRDISTVNPDISNDDEWRNDLIWDEIHEDEFDIDTFNNSKIDKSKFSGLTKDKKLILKNMLGKCSFPIDLNKVRDEYKNQK